MKNICSDIIIYENNIPGIYSFLINESSIPFFKPQAFIYNNGNDINIGYAISLYDDDIKMFINHGLLQNTEILPCIFILNNIPINIYATKFMIIINVLTTCSLKIAWTCEI